jgi:hypothetical protein
VEEAGAVAAVIAHPSAPAIDEGALYRCLEQRLAALIPLCGLAAQRSTIQSAYRLLCAEPLTLPAGRRPLRGSRLNADGTPFQFALAVGKSGPRLGFITDTGSPLAGNAERLAAARHCLGNVLRMAGDGKSLPRLSDLLDELAPANDPDLLADEAGAVWIGTAFAPGHAPRIKLYLNAKWGRQPGERWSRLATFASRLGFARPWEVARAGIEQLEPLGMSLTVATGAEPAARIYLSGYGLSLDYYERLASGHGGPGFARLVRDFGETVLADDCRHPTRSAVWSVGFEHGATVDCKLELCGHCTFASDTRARERCGEWLRRTEASTETYEHVVETLSGGVASSVGASLHAYVGVGARREQPYSTFYFNPATEARRV